MSIKIHHGPPGSYKTSGSMEDLVRAAKDGRLIISNVRGICEDSIRAVYKDLPESFSLLFIDTEDSREERAKLASFWLWAPHDAFFMIDEAQSIWRKELRKNELQALSHYQVPDDVEITDGKRPEDFWEAFEKHRHYGWDFVLTCQDLKQLHSDIRMTAEMAYQHRNLADIGLKRRYLEVQHSAASNSTNRSDIRRVRKIPKEHFSLYESTTTGEVRDTTAGLSLFQNRKIMGFTILFILLVAVLVYRGLPGFLGGESKGVIWQDRPSTKQVGQSSPSTVKANTVQSSDSLPAQGRLGSPSYTPNVSSASTVPVVTASSGPLDPEYAPAYILVGSLGKSENELDNGPILRTRLGEYIDPLTLTNLGYGWEWKNASHVVLLYDDKELDVYAFAYNKSRTKSK